MAKLLLVDGSAILHRAYHAYPPLTAPDGRVVGAVYGVVSIVLTFIKSLAPTHIMIAWDLSAPTFRHKRYVGYKAQRPKADKEMIEQIDEVKKLIAVMGVAQIEQAGYEGDDIIGTIAKKFGAEMDETIILTGDQDTMQLVNERVVVLLPPKGKDPVTLYGPEQVKERYGVLPNQIVDYKALVGDASDNIPGVWGIGKKTARDLIVKYASLDEVYNHLEELAEKTRVKLVEGKESAYLSQELSRIYCEMELAFDIDDLRLGEMKSEKLKERLLELGFKSLVKRVFGMEENPKTSMNTHQVSLF